MSHGGKGDKPRPLSVPIEEFDNRWETIFGKKKQPEGEKVVDQVENTILKDEYFKIED